VGIPTEDLPRARNDEENTRRPATPSCTDVIASSRPKSGASRTNGQWVVIKMPDNSAAPALGPHLCKLSTISGTRASRPFRARGGSSVGRRLQEKTSFGQIYRAARRINRRTRHIALLTVNNDF
jgi:hypothetical protein